MRSRFTITITDYRGARHYSLRHIVKSFAVGGAALLLTALLLGSVTIAWLTRQLDDLEARRFAITALNEQLQNRNQVLVESIAEKGRDFQHAQQDLVQVNAKLARANEDLDQISNDLEDIEVMVGLRPDPEADMNTRLDTASQTAREKMLMLESIPSGSPLQTIHINSGFGWRKNPVNGKKQFHAGLDLKAAKNTPVYATADGIVETAGITKGKSFGKVLILVHDYGFRTYYAHLNKILVQIGQYVRKGDKVALSGNSGRTTAPHLHYEVRHLTNRLNPRHFVEWTLEHYDSLFEKETRVQWDSLATLIRRQLENAEQLSSLKDQELKAN